MAYQLASDVIRTQHERLAEEIVRRYFSGQDSDGAPFEPSEHSKSIRDAGYHLTYLAEALALQDLALFSEYILWVRSLFEALQFHPNLLSDTLDCTLAVLREALPPEAYQPVEETMRIARQRLQHAPTEVASNIRAENPQSELAQQFLALLLKGDQRSAGALILDAHQHKNVSIQDLYLHVFQVTQREIGRLWQLSLISVAKEHYCTAATQLIMGQLYPFIFKGNLSDKKVIVSCAQGELHELGARMVADFFELDGWDSHFLGANTPSASILDTITEIQPQVLALSATMTFHVQELAQLIRQVKTLPDVPKILVGGYPFNLSTTLWQKIGADGYAADASQAVLAANQWELRN